MTTLTRTSQECNTRYQRSYGDKYNRDLDGPGIAKAIRGDIKEAVKRGELPDGVYSVRFRWATHSYAIDVTMRHLEGVAVLNPERVRWDAERGSMHDLPPQCCQIYNEQGNAISKKLEAIMWAYNHDGSDIQTDYFDVNFYGHATFDQDFLQAERERILAGKPAEATEPYKPEKRPAPKPKPTTADLLDIPVIGELGTIEVYGRPYTIEKLDEDAQAGRPIIRAYVLTSKRGAKIALLRHDGPNMWTTNADVMKASSPLKDVWFNDADGTLAVGYYRETRKLRVVGGFKGICDVQAKYCQGR